ncbi:ABC transporter substrate-binding protein [Mycetocola reblochoni]|uniref:Ribose ABC transporter, periplasmic ribose-binding protein RbsB (TC 3.A.1.2.1) n=2 Tax=Mycetocola reblochoni TaxID=331618 RepID=A0A1R4IH61_9MICO|nr:ABC transporter substrate-binding protein [Mycetocola reblochoni]RLP69684.1 ABC transporter substrate-binding protein [Mycetocola reblochoni]SJN19177.1 Ribose ABC transporter, periplasmic ribose-binding protein RbsB (TC 3.A.1.2.1) [Mycetocola reblochoni REB411]
MVFYTPTSTRGRAAITGAALAAAAVLALGGCTSTAGGDPASGGDGEGFVIGVANGQIGNTWRAQYIAEIEAVADELTEEGVVSDLIVASTNADVSEQLSQLNDMLTRGVDAIMVNPVSSTALEPFIEKAKAQGVLVVVNDNAAAYDGTYFVGYPQTDYWTIQTRWLAETLGGEGSIVTVGGVAGMTADELRQQGAAAVLEDFPDIDVLAEGEGEWSQTTAESVMSSYLSAYPDIDGVLVQEVMPEGVLRAFEKAGRDYVPTTGDYNYGFLRKWQEQPELDSIAITNSPHIGADGVKIMVRLLQGQTFKEGELTANPLDPELVNAFLVPYPYVITREGEQDAAWMEGISPTTTAVTLDEVIADGEGAEDGESVGVTISDDALDAVFETK